MKTTPPRITLRKVPRQARALATVEAILKAAAQLLAEAGPAAVTTNRVAERAGVSIGSLYQYFPTKEAILAELVRDLRVGMLADMAGVLEGGAHRDWPLERLVLALCRAALEHHRRAPDLARVLEQVADMLPLDAETDARKAELGAIIAGVLAERGFAAPVVAARDLNAMAAAIAGAATAAGEEDFDALARRIARAAMGYLQEYSVSTLC